MILAEIDWGEIAQTYGLPGALLLLVLWYVGRVMLPRTYKAFDTATEAFKESLEKQTSEFRDECREQRESHQEVVQQLLAKINGRASAT